MRPIDADGLLKEINDVYNGYMLSEQFAPADFERMVEEAPTVETVPAEKWIPVSERLPEEVGRYLVTVQNLTGYEPLDNNVFECEFYTDWIFKGWKDNKVIAWMPLPQPYKAESEVQE